MVLTVGERPCATVCERRSRQVVRLAAIPALLSPSLDGEAREIRGDYGTVLLASFRSASTSKRDAGRAATKGYTARAEGPAGPAKKLRAGFIVGRVSKVFGEEDLAKVPLSLFR